MLLGAWCNRTVAAGVLQLGQSHFPIAVAKSETGRSRLSSLWRVWPGSDFPMLALEPRRAAIEEAFR